MYDCVHDYGLLPRRRRTHLHNRARDATGVREVYNLRVDRHDVALHDALHPVHDKWFRIKPKLHMFLHVCSDGSRPARYWAYRDEDYGGSVARLSRRRGGCRNATATSLNVLQRFAILNPMVRIV